MYAVTPRGWLPVTWNGNPAHSWLHREMRYIYVTGNEQCAVLCHLLLSRTRSCDRSLLYTVCCMYVKKCLWCYYFCVSTHVCVLELCSFFICKSLLVLSFAPPLHLLLPFVSSSLSSSSIVCFLYGSYEPDGDRPSKTNVEANNVSFRTK